MEMLDVMLVRAAAQGVVFRVLCMTPMVLLPCLLALTRPGPATHFLISRRYWWGYVDPIKSGAVDAGWTLS